jgi:hypothetical protein
MRLDEQLACVRGDHLTVIAVPAMPVTAAAI